MEPDLSARGAAAVLQLDVRVDAADLATVTGGLTPGVDEDGFLRGLSRAAVRVAGREVDPAHVTEVGTRVYADTTRLPPDSRTQGVSIEAPVVIDVDASFPVLHWPAVARIGADTVRLDADGGVTLGVGLAGQLSPMPDVMQWTLRVEGGAGAATTITRTGLPPEQVRMQSDLLPESATHVWSARLTLFLSASLMPEPGDYVGLVALQTSIEWTLVGAGVAERAR